jgi:hypothetical protein
MEGNREVVERESKNFSSFWPWGTPGGLLECDIGIYQGDVSESGFCGTGSDHWRGASNTSSSLMGYAEGSGTDIRDESVRSDTSPRIQGRSRSIDDSGLGDMLGDFKEVATSPPGD